MNCCWKCAGQQTSYNTAKWSPLSQTMEKMAKHSEYRTLVNPGGTLVRPAQRLRTIGPEAVHGVEQPLGYGSGPHSHIRHLESHCEDSHQNRVEVGTSVIDTSIE